MRTLLVSMAIVCLAVSLPGARWTRQGNPLAPAHSTIEAALRAYRADLQANRGDVIAKNITLTSAQTKTFWPAYKKYQMEQSAIMDAQLKGIREYVDGYGRLDDATALAMMRANFDRDRKMNELRQKWLAEFQKILPAKLAVRVMQIDRRLSLAHQLEFASQIPVVE